MPPLCAAGLERDLGDGEVDLALVVGGAAGGGTDALVVDRQPLAGDVGAPLVDGDLAPRRAGTVDDHVGEDGRTGDDCGQRHGRQRGDCGETADVARRSFEWRW